MRRLAAGVAIPVLLALAAPGHAEDSFAHPSCIASTLPEARAQTRLVPPEARGEPALKLRGVVLRAVTWKPGQTIKVCFLGGSLKAQQRVLGYAREWMQYANVMLDFEENGAPRRCIGDNHEDIKVAFMDGKGWWSLPGVLSRRQQPSMNLQYWGSDTPQFANGNAVPEAEMRTTILHEFGHALGLLHEHQSPGANCDAEIDWEAAYKIGGDIGWDKPQVDRNFRQLAGGNEFNATEVDRRSIMHYSLPPQIFKSGKDSLCWVARNSDLSEQDRKFIASIYPKEDKPVVVSSAPTGTATRSAAKRPATGDDRSALVRQYEELLKQSGVPAGKIRELTAEFGKSMAGK
jgi:hypothetical protein